MSKTLKRHTSEDINCKVSLSKKVLDSSYTIDDSQKLDVNSEAILVYKMHSKQFDYDMIRSMPNFAVRQYKHSLYRG